MNFKISHCIVWTTELKKMDQIRRPNRRFRKNSPFNGEQAAFILIKFEQSKSIKEVQRAFRKGFYTKNLREVPNILAFTRIMQRFKEESALRPQVPAGRSSEPLRNNIEAVKKIFRAKSKMPHKGGSKSPWLKLLGQFGKF